MATKRETTAPKTQPSHGVFVVENDGPAAFWTRIGVAWSHADGDGLNVILTAIPVSGRIVIRTRKDKQETGE